MLLLLLALIMVMPVLFQAYTLGLKSTKKLETVYDQSLAQSMRLLSVSLGFYIHDLEIYLKSFSQKKDLLSAIALEAQQFRDTGGLPDADRLNNIEEIKGQKMISEGAGYDGRTKNGRS